MFDVRPAWHGEPRVETIHDRVKDHAVRNLELVAILAAGRSPLTYAQLATQIGHVGKELGLANIGGSDRVAVVLPPDAEAAVATLAIAAHAACAPLNPAYSEREFEFYLSSLRAKALLVLHGTSSPAIAAAKSLNLRILYLLPETKSPARIFSLLSDSELDRNDQGPAAASHPALLLFTSGTTARPRLAPLTHRQLCLSADNIGSALQLEPRDRCLGVMPLFHIHGLSTLFATLVSGGSYVSMSGFSPESFFACLEEFQPTWYSASPAIHRAIFDSAQYYRSNRAGSALRFIRSASAPMPKQLITDMESAFGVPLIEAYGMTEAAPQIASNRLPPFKRKPGSVGTPAGPDVAIRDETGHILPAGRTGEVIIRGPHVIDGYDSDPIADEEIFSGGWLRTGDLGHFDADGYLFITGRLNEIVNRGGEKISPAVIEQVLLEHPAIAQAVVFGIPHSVLGETLAAAVVLKPAQTLAQPVRQIRDFVAERLARFERPQRIVVVDQIPLGPTGKVARKELARVLGLSERDGEGHPSLTAKITPRTATERRVAEVFAEVLKTVPPGIHDDFFELGGHSLAAMQVLVRLQQVFQTKLPIDFLFAGSTVAGLAERIGEHVANLLAEGAARLEQTVEAGVAHGRIARRHDATPAPLSFAQQGIYFLDRLGVGAAYNVSASLWLTGQLDEHALALALNEIVRRHDILRTHFPVRGDHPVQMVAPPHKVDLASIDLASHAETDRAAEAMAFATQEACQAFDLENGPLFRAKLVRLSREEAVLLLTMHHIVSDGWSISILYKELKQLYAAYRDCRAPPLAELPLQYADFASWQQRSVEEGRLDREAAYWTRQLDQLPPACTFPSDRPRPPIRSYRGAIEQMFIEGPLIDRLKSFASRENVTLFMTLLAAFKTLLFRHNGQDDCVVGVPIASRPQQELESLIGFFANTLVMRSSLADGPSFTEFLARVRASVLGAFVHQDIPIELIMENLRVSRDRSGTPLFQVMFAFQNMPETSGSSGESVDLFARPSFDLAPGLAARPFRVDNKTAKFDLTLYLSEVDEGMSVTWQFNTDLFDPATIRRLARQFQTLLQGIADDPRKRLSELPLLSEADSRQAEIDWNRTETRQRSSRNFVQLFEAQVERTPNAMAVRGGDSELTYRDLNERANQFARYFQGLGVGHDHRTGVCLPRTPEMLAVLLGIWKAGGAFLPLDLDYPPERIVYTLRHAGVPLLVTQAALLPRVAAAI